VNLRISTSFDETSRSIRIWTNNSATLPILSLAVFRERTLIIKTPRLTHAITPSSRLSCGHGGVDAQTDELGHQNRQSVQTPVGKPIFS